MARSRNEEILYGRQPALETLRAGRRKALSLVLREGIKPSAELESIISEAKRRHVSQISVGGRELDRLCNGGNHQGVAVRVTPYPYASDKAVMEPGPSGRDSLVLVMDHLEDPQNVGSLLRTADSAGVSGVIIAERRAAGITPAVVRASAGAAEHVKVARVTNISHSIDMLKKRGIWVAGLEAVEGSELCSERDLTGPLALVVGSEGAGMKRLVREHCDFLVRLPMLGRVSSLNVGVAGGMALYEIVRQRMATDARQRG